MADGEDVVEFAELALDLIGPGLVRDEQQHAAGGTIVERDADDRLQIERAAREQAGDVGHRAGMIAHAEFEDRIRWSGKSVTYYVTLA